MHAYHFKLIKLCGRIEGFFVLSAVKSASRVVASIKYRVLLKNSKNSRSSFLQPKENDVESQARINAD